MICNKRNSQYRDYRWAVERPQYCLNLFRKLLVRVEETPAGYEGVLELTDSLIALGQRIITYG